MNAELRRFLSHLVGVVGFALSVVSLVAFAAVPLGRDATLAQDSAAVKHMT